MKNICVFDNILSNKECEFLINNLKNNIQGSYGDPHNYNYCNVAYDDNEILSNLTKNIIEQYTKLNPEINLTYNKWKLQNFKFKEFIPGNSYNKFHSEQSFNRPRILSILVYLSTHNCGTEFYNGEIIKSIKGRALVFPAFWTHTHKGQPCPDNKHRYLLSAYINLINDR
mgnify:FL=1|tara:strand:+ start:953 stop:1462 length:510 start_codon:yes stop_codon:yes gene_type:complete